MTPVVLRFLSIVTVGVATLIPAPAAAFSGEPPTPAEVLAKTEVIVVARAGPALGSIGGGTDRPLRTLYLLDVEGYIRPSEPGPDTLVVATIGGQTLDSAMDGPQLPHQDRPALYFLRRDGAQYGLAAGPFTPVIPLSGGRFDPAFWGEVQPAFRPLLDEPRHPPFQPPAVRVNGRRIGADVPPRIVNGRTLIPSDALAPALGASLEPVGGGALEMRRRDSAVRISPDAWRLEIERPDGRQGLDIDVQPRWVGGKLLVPLRHVAEALGARVHWNEAAWAVEVTVPGGVAEPRYLCRDEAVGRVLSGRPAIFSVSEARFVPNWLDPRTGAEVAVWELSISEGGPSPWMTVIVDAVTGEHLLYRPNRGQARSQSVNRHAPGGPRERRRLGRGQFEYRRNPPSPPSVW